MKIEPDKKVKLVRGGENRNEENGGKHILVERIHMDRNEANLDGTRRAYYSKLEYNLHFR